MSGIPIPKAGDLGLKPGFSAVALTGAGISAESGIPTFRGTEGYWRVGSKNYMPQELATAKAFSRMPREVWRWYLWRRDTCRRARPNAGHAALALLAMKLGPERFALITQNVDGLHARSGIPEEMLFEIHGNINRFRCAGACPPKILDLHPELVLPHGEAALTDAHLARLTCPGCGQLGRPHVLWFDEYYDEALFRSDSAVARAAEADLLLIVGTSFATTLPAMICEYALQQDLAVIEINPEPSPFTAMVERSPRGRYLQGRAAEVLPALVPQLMVDSGSPGSRPGPE